MSKIAFKDCATLFVRNLEGETRREILTRAMEEKEEEEVDIPEKRKKKTQQKIMCIYGSRRDAKKQNNNASRTVWYCKTKSCFVCNLGSECVTRTL